MLKKSLVLLSLCAVMSLEAGKGHKGKPEKSEEKESTGWFGMGTEKSEEQGGDINNNSLKGRMKTANFNPAGIAAKVEKGEELSPQQKAFNDACKSLGLKDCATIQSFFTGKNEYRNNNKGDEGKMEVYRGVMKSLNEAFPKS